jgi:signal peptidase complex subunit 1
MDWEGQKLSEQLMQYLLLGFGLVAFLTGYIVSSYRTMLIVYVTGVVITFLIAVPEWPFFNRHPLEWSEPPPTGVANSRLMKQRQQQAAKKSAKPAGKR